MTESQLLPIKLNCGYCGCRLWQERQMCGIKPRQYLCCCGTDLGILLIRVSCREMTPIISQEQEGDSTDSLMFAVFVEVWWSDAWAWLIVDALSILGQSTTPCVLPNFPNHVYSKKWWVHSTVDSRPAWLLRALFCYSHCSPRRFSCFTLPLFPLWKWASVHSDLQPHPRGGGRRRKKGGSSSRMEERIG